VVETVAISPVTLATADAALADAYAEWECGLQGFRRGMLAWYRGEDPGFNEDTQLLAETLRVVWSPDVVPRQKSGNKIGPDARSGPVQQGGCDQMTP
jgi:hypothetical protein